MHEIEKRVVGRIRRTTRETVLGIRVVWSGTACTLGATFWHWIPVGWPESYSVFRFAHWFLVFFISGEVLTSLVRPFGTGFPWAGPNPIQFLGAPAGF